jgi:hypothetical protein
MSNLQQEVLENIDWFTSRGYSYYNHIIAHYDITICVYQNKVEVLQASHYLRIFNNLKSLQKYLTLYPSNGNMGITIIDES